MSRNKSNIKWEYVTNPFDVYAFATAIRRAHAPLDPSLSINPGGRAYLHLRPCVQGVDQDGAVIKYLYCTRDGRFFVRKKDGWGELLPVRINSPRKSKAKGGNYDIPAMRDFGNKPCHRCVAFAWLDVPREVLDQINGIGNCGAPDTNQQSVCGGEEPRHTSPLCRSAASDATVLPKAWEVDHINTDHKNWTADNLQWVTVEENRRRGKIARKLRAIGIDPKRVYLRILKGIYRLPDDYIGTLTGMYLWLCQNEFGDQPLDIRTINATLAAALDEVNEKLS